MAFYKTDTPFVFLPKFCWSTKKYLPSSGGSSVTTNLLGTLLTAANTSLHSIFFNFLLVHGDADDNKFADTYLSANADYLVSNDAKLLALRSIAIPPVQVITLHAFALLLSHTITGDQ